MDTQLFEDIVEIMNLYYMNIGQFIMTGWLNPTSALVISALVESAESRLNSIAHKLDFNLALYVRFILNSSKHMYNTCIMC